jgi:hypothetical protein
VKRNPFLIRLQGGPADGVTIQVKADWKVPERLLVFQAQYTIPGMWMCADPAEEDPLEGDALYACLNRSQLPDDFEHPNVIRGADFGFDCLAAALEPYGVSA